jgi:hypothetical protein
MPFREKRVDTVARTQLVNALSRGSQPHAIGRRLARDARVPVVVRVAARPSIASSARGPRRHTPYCDCARRDAARSTQTPGRAMRTGHRRAPNALA